MFNLQWFELPMSRTNFHDPKYVRAIEVRLSLKFYRLSGAMFYDCNNTIYQFIKSFLDIKMSIVEENGAFKPPKYCIQVQQSFRVKNSSFILCRF